VICPSSRCVFAVGGVEFPSVSFRHKSRGTPALYCLSLQVSVHPSSRAVSALFWIFFPRLAWALPQRSGRPALMCLGGLIVLPFLPQCLCLSRIIKLVPVFDVPRDYFWLSLPTLMHAFFSYSPELVRTFLTRVCCFRPEAGSPDHPFLAYNLACAQRCRLPSPPKRVFPTFPADPAKSLRPSPLRFRVASPPRSSRCKSEPLAPYHRLNTRDRLRNPTTHRHVPWLSAACFWNPSTTCASRCRHR